MEEKTKNTVSNEIDIMVKYLDEQSNNNKINKGKLSFIETPKDSLSQLLNESINNENKILKFQIRLVLNINENIIQ